MDTIVIKETVASIEAPPFMTKEEERLLTYRNRRWGWMIWLATPKTLPEYMFYTGLAPRGISWSRFLP